MIAIRGAKSAIAYSLIRLLPKSERVKRVPRGGRMPMNAARYLFCAGALHLGPIESFWVNCSSITDRCDEILERNPLARICVIGSESGFTWSFDGDYAAAKAALHRYVETKKLRHPGQQLVCIAPGIIADAGMTTRREDTGRLRAREVAHPKRRFLFSGEVAKLVHHVLYVDEGYLSGIVIRMNGGEHIR